MNKYLLIDVGNSSVKFCIATKNELLHIFSLASDAKLSSDTYGIQFITLLNHLKLNSSELKSAYIASVVPQLNNILEEAIIRFMNIPVYFVPENISIPLNNKYGKPSEVGADRLVGAYAARVLYPKPRAIISVDFGTATTFDCIQDNDYLGGLIAPGLLSSRDSLARLTAKLPRTNLDIEAKNTIIGQDTITSINHGFLFGFVAMAEGLIARLKKELASDCLVIATGGYAKTLAKHTNCFDKIEQNLILDGLRFRIK